tara:strand:+ start:856 stop:1137 length:282 start_codon:yes stop_codon:yes gene_type:complete
MSGALLQENFEKALETINALSEQNEALMDEIQSLKFKLSLSNNEIKPIELSPDDEERYARIAEGAEAAMKRYKQFLKKEFPHAKSKQSKRQSV